MLWKKVLFSPSGKVKYKAEENDSTTVTFWEGWWLLAMPSPRMLYSVTDVTATDVLTRNWGPAVLVL